jgi:hypothetical protein
LIEFVIDCDKQHNRQRSKYRGLGRKGRAGQARMASDSIAETSYIFKHSSTPSAQGQ